MFLLLALLAPVSAAAGESVTLFKAARVFDGVRCTPTGWSRAEPWLRPEATVRKGFTSASMFRWVLKQRTALYDYKMAMNELIQTREKFA